MKKLITIILAITLMACAYPPPIMAQAPQPVQQDNQLAMRQMELRALIAEIELLKQQNQTLVDSINLKVERARILQAQIQAAQTPPAVPQTKEKK